jgi:tetratricopeptide (TPR) repeat protein
VRRHRLLLFLAAVFAAKLVVVLQLREHPLLQLDVPIRLIEPVYVAFLTLMLRLTRVLSAIRIVQIALGTAAVGCVFSAARTWFGERAAWLAALFAALTGLFTFYETAILPAALDPFLTAAALAALAAGLSGHRAWLGAAAVSLTLLLLNRPPVVLGGLYFYIGNNATADGTYRPVPGIAADDMILQREDARQVAEASSGRRLGDLGVAAYFAGLGRTWIGLHPGAAAANFGRKAALVFNAGHVATSHSFRFFADESETLLRGLFVGPWLLLPLGLLGLVLGAFHMRRGPFLVWASFVPVYAFGLAMLFVSERNRLPLLVPLCVGAGAAGDFFISRGSRPSPVRLPFRRGASLAAAFALLCVLVPLTNWRMRYEDGRAEDMTRMAEAMVVRDRIDLAEQWASRALAIHPRPADVHLRIGRRLVVHSRPDAALTHLERALQLDPSSADARYAIGQALVQARRPREAIPYLRAALKGGVAESLAGYELARALAALGDRAGALQTLQTVRPERPSDVESWNALGQLALLLDSPSLAATFFNGAARAQQLRQEGR